MKAKQEWEPVLERVSRAVQELRHGGTVVLLAQDQAYGVQAAESAGAESLRSLGGAPQLVMSGVRAQKLGIAKDKHAPVCVEIPQPVRPEDLRQMIDPAAGAPKPLALSPRVAGEAERAAIALAKYGALLPAVLMVPFTGPDDHFPSVTVEEISRYKEALALTLAPVEQTALPIRPPHEARLVTFRPPVGAVEHLAVLVGAPEQETAPLVRVHSSCLTGDVLGSLHCDCGEQLHYALEKITAAGSGVILYLNQEGRGIGIVNKLRAYALQDKGFDTVEANEEMGFEMDERHFQPAAEMLRKLGIPKVRLLTNNPHKVEELSHYGIEVVGREPLVIPPNAHNQFYLDTKAKRCGHWL